MGRPSACIFATQHEAAQFVQTAVNIADGVSEGHCRSLFSTAVRCSMMAIFRHIRSVRVHQKMGTYARWGRLEFCKEPTLVEVNIMRKILTALVAAVAIAASAVATSGTAEAGWGGWHGGWHGGLGLGSRPGHRRTCGWRADRRCFGGAVCLSIPYGYYTGYYASPPYGGPCVWRRVWNGYGWVRACV